MRRRREQAHRVAGIHDERLLLRHLGQVVHDEPELREFARLLHSGVPQNCSRARRAYLGPVGEYLPVAAVRDELFRILRHERVQIVHDHVHDRGRRPRFARTLVDRISPAQSVQQRAPGECASNRVPDRHIGQESVHVNVAVLPQLVGELFGQFRVQSRGEVAQRVADGELETNRAERETERERWRKKAAVYEAG